MASVLPLTRHRLSVDQFHEMGRAGIFAPEARVELIEGELIDMAPIGSRHASAVATLTVLLARGCGDAILFPQNPIVIPPWSEPQPDFALLAPRKDRYRDELPGPADVLLLIEVSDSTLAYDRRVKLPLYARHGVRETWIVNLQDNRIEVYRQPVDGRYRLAVEYAAIEDVVSPAFAPALRVPLAALFGGLS